MAEVIRVTMISAYPNPGCEPRGGVERSTARLVAALSGTGADVTVVAPGPAGSFQDGDTTAIYVGNHGRFTLAREFRPWRRAVRQVLAAIPSDVVHAQGLLAGLPLLDAEPPRVVTAHGHVGADIVGAYSGLGRGVRQLLGKRLAKAAVRSAEVVVGVHPDWRLNVPVRPRMFAHIPTIVDDLFFSAEHRPEGATVLFCGGPRRIKGWDVLARAWPRVLDRVPDASLHVAGWPDGAPPPTLEDGTPVADSGWLSSPLLRAAMEKGTLLVIPSRFEISPLVLLEAWAVGLPVVAAAAGGLATLARGAAELVPTDDPRALGHAIAGVLSGERPVHDLVAEGRERAARCRAASVAEEHLSLYAKLLEG